MNLLIVSTNKKTKDGRPEVVAIPYHAIKEIRYVLGGENCGECYINGELFSISFNDAVDRAKVG